MSWSGSLSTTGRAASPIAFRRPPLVASRAPPALLGEGGGRGARLRIQRHPRRLARPAGADRRRARPLHGDLPQLVAAVRGPDGAGQPLRVGPARAARPALSPAPGRPVVRAERPGHHGAVRAGPAQPPAGRHPGRPAGALLRLRITFRAGRRYLGRYRSMPPEERTMQRHQSNTAKSGPPPDRPPTPAPPPPPRWRSWLPLIGLLLSLLILYLPSMTNRQQVQQLNYTQLKEKLTAGQVQSVSIGSDGHIDGKLKGGQRFRSAKPNNLDDPDFAKLLDEQNVQVTAVGAQTSVWSVVISFLPLLLFVGFFVYLGRSTRRQLAGMGGLGRSRARVFDMERPDTTFADVAGYEGAKREVTEVVDFLRNPDRYRRAGAVGPKGVLMVGPPGTGKTLLARAVAGEARVPFLSVTGSSFVEMFVGVGAARVRDLFADARKRAPPIIFIDEIDAIGQRRGGQVISNDERDQTLNQMLSEMDGFDPATGVVVMAATNRPEVLDPALLRPGRFDRQVVIPLPTQRERKAILEVHSVGKKLGPDVDLDVV